MNAKEKFVTITWNDWCPPHPIWFCTIHVCPTLTYCIVHQLPGQINLKPLPAVLIQIHLLPSLRSNLILSTINHSHIKLMDYPVKQPKEYAKISPVSPHWCCVVGGVSVIICDPRHWSIWSNSFGSLVLGADSCPSDLSLSSWPPDKVTGASTNIRCV